MDSTKEIDVLRLVKVALRRWYIIIGAGILCAALVLLYTVFLVTPLYSATAKVYIKNKVDYNTNQEEVNINDVYSSQALVPVYSTMIRTNMVLDKVLESPELVEAGIDYTTADLSNMISTEQEDETAVLAITVVNPDKEICSLIANAVVETGIAEIANVAPGSSADLLEPAETPEKPFSPAVGRDGIIGFFVGAFVAVLVIVLKDIFDTKIKDEDVLSAIIDAPVLGRIGEIHNARS